MSVPLHHIAFRTFDVPRLEAFYVDVLGLAVHARPAEGRVWLAAGGLVVMIERAELGEPGIPNGSMELVAFAIDEAAKGDVEARLASAGVAIEARTPFTMYVRDPDGRRIGVSHYAFARS